jgi:tRNA A-37 threonylcarbamoyl transferase component Bud32
MSPESPNACPEREELAAYALGLLPPERIEALGQHVAGCTRCESELERDTPPEDDFVRQLRQLGAEAAEPTSQGEGAGLSAGEATTVPNRPPGRASSGRAAEVSFGKFDILEHLGSGGMSTVDKVRDRKLGWIVALKRLRPDRSTVETRARFLNEARTIAVLKHPNIVEIRELGEANGEPYHVLEYMEGGSLEAEIARRKEQGRSFEPEEIARLVECLARAVQCAHDRKILHRDLKPGNVLLTADGVPKVADFGLAKLLDLDQTQSHLLLGTIPYMSPEQAQRGRVSFATDIYALGVILYRLLTGRLPFAGRDSDELLGQIVSDQVERPSTYRPGLSPDLEAICLECLEKRPGQRYASAGALADDLAAFQRGDPVSVRPRGRLARAVREVRRYPLIAALVLCQVLGVALVGGAVWYSDPNRPLREIEGDLAAGRTVTLLAEQGPPRWSRLRLSDAETKTFTDPEDGSFALASYDLALLELVRDPQTSRYRVRAQVRMDRESHQGRVGLYARRRELPAEQGLLQAFVEFSYNDLRPAMEFPAGAPVHLLPQFPGNPIDLFVHLYQRRGREHTDDAIHHNVRPPARIQRDWKQVKRTWRDLVLEVTPEEVRCTWDGIPSGPVRLALYRDPLADKIPRYKVNKGAKLQPTPEDCLPIRGGVGLFVVRATASFRSVTIEPLPAESGKE